MIVLNGDFWHDNMDCNVDVSLYLRIVMDVCYSRRDEMYTSKDRGEW